MTTTTNEPTLTALSISFIAVAISLYVLIDQIQSDASMVKIGMAAAGFTIFAVLLLMVLWQFWKG